MLSISYGQDQSTGLTQAHRPGNYPAQSLEIRDSQHVIYSIFDRDFKGSLLKTRNFQRYEIVLYWLVVGDVQVVVDINRNLTQLLYGLGGGVPDGLVFSISIRESDGEIALDVLIIFVDQLSNSLETKDLSLLLGGI